MKKKISIVNVGKIYIDEAFTAVENEDHTKICVWADGMEFPKLSLTIPGLQALYAEIGDQLRAFEKLRNPQ